MFVYLCTAKFIDGYLEQWCVLADSLDQAEKYADVDVSRGALSHDGIVEDISIVKKEI